MRKIIVKDKSINIQSIKDEDYISLTDIARIKNEDDTNLVISNWLRKVDTIEFLKLWESINNENFKPIDFEGFKSKPGENAFSISSRKWIELTDAIGIKSKPGKYGGGTFAHKDIALEFASWISPEIKLYIIKEFQRLKYIESEKKEWENKRLLSKINYLLHTDAIKEKLRLVNLSSEQIHYIYASEADLLNVALFGLKAKEWKEKNPDEPGNMRDYASIIELAILSNIEYYNSLLIKENISQKDRLLILNKEANRQKELFNRNLNLNNLLEKKNL